MNAALIAAIRYNQTKKTKGRGYTSGTGLNWSCIILIVFLILMLVGLTLLIVSQVTAEIEVLETTTLTVTELVADTKPKYDKFFVSLSNGMTFEIGQYTFAKLEPGDSVEFSKVIKHSFLGDESGWSIAGDFVFAH